MKPPNLLDKKMANLQKLPTGFHDVPDSLQRLERIAVAHERRLDQIQSERLER